MPEGCYFTNMVSLMYVFPYRSQFLSALFDKSALASIFVITQADHWLRKISNDENGFITEEQFEEGVRRTRINTELYVRLLAKDRSFRLINLNTFKSIVCVGNQI